MRIPTRSTLTIRVSIVIGLMWVACSSVSAKEIKLADIEGTWNTTRFESDGKSQTPQSPILFRITKDMEITQEGNGLSFTDKFEIKGNALIIKAPSGDLTYKISDYSGKAMKLEAKAAMGSTFYFLEKK